MSEEKRNPEVEEQEEGPKNWKDIAEVRMVMYVIPVAIVFLVVALILSNLGD